LTNTCYGLDIKNRLEIFTFLLSIRKSFAPKVFAAAVATLIQGSGTSYLDWLWSRNTHYLFDYDVCLTAFLIYFVMTIWTAGSAIAGGVFVPVLWVTIYCTLYDKAQIPLRGLVTDFVANISVCVCDFRDLCRRISL